MTTATATTQAQIRRGTSSNSDPAAAAAELFELVQQDAISLVTFFCAPSYDRDILGAELSRLFGPAGAPVVGCTTAGEISETGFTEGGITAVSLGAPDFKAVARVIEDVHSMDVVDAQKLVESMEKDLRDQAGELDLAQCFAFLVIDGLSMREEVLTYALQGSLGEIDLIGGSAGDGLDFGQTFVYFDGEFRQNAAVLTIVHTDRPFRVFKTQHFAATSEKVVVTEADAERRIVKEINGMPAAEEYARLLNVTVEELTPRVFARNPVMVRMGGNWYARSIQKVNDDGTLTIYCAIDEGIVLTLGRGLGLVDTLDEAFDDICKEIGRPQLTLGFDCILRRLEVEEFELTNGINPILAKNNVIGFSTYGEQFGSTHVNQTFTGVAIS